MTILHSKHRRIIDIILKAREHRRSYSVDKLEQEFGVRWIGSGVFREVWRKDGIVYKLSHWDPEYEDVTNAYENEVYTAASRALQDRLVPIMAYIDDVIVQPYAGVEYEKIHGTVWASEADREYVLTTEGMLRATFSGLGIDRSADLHWANVNEGLLAFDYGGA